jgi:hypothetical protein
MCTFHLLPVLLEKVEMRVIAVDALWTNCIHCANPHPALSRSTGRGEERVGAGACDCLEMFVEI